MDERERARLREVRLYGLAELDAQQPDQDLDRAAALLRALTGAASAAVHVVDGTRQLRVGAVGAQREVRDRAGSLCAVAMQHPGPDGVFTTDDPVSDPLLADVAGAAQVGPYVAVPLLAGPALPLGTLCAWDPPGSPPRPLSAAVREGAVELAALVCRLLELRRHGAALERDALADPVTGLPGERLLLDRLAQALARRERTDGEPFTCLLALVGLPEPGPEHDRLVAAFAQRLLRLLRPEDTVARWKGGEFVVVAERLHAATFEVLLTRMRAALDEPLPGAAPEMALLLGSALGQAGDSPEALLDRADSALGAARRRAQRR